MSSAKFSKAQKSTPPNNEETADYLLLAKEEKIVLSETEYQKILALLSALREDKSIIVAPKKYMTTQESADFLNVSRPYLIKLLEEGEIRFHKVGNRRRVDFDDLLIYKNQRDSKRHKILQDFSST